MANPEHLERLKQGVEVWNQWRKYYPQTVPDLSGEDLSRHVLVGFELHNVNLNAANLFGVTFANTDLNESNLKGAALSWADFSGASLFSADLSQANFIDTNLNAANLNGAKFQDAIFGRTSLGNTDLSQVIGLETATHYFPSTIGIDTLYKSQGNIPDVFLRGCGVPESFITFQKSLVNTPIEFFSCFISYSHEDKSFARRLHDQLQARGIRCWLDEHQMLPGHDLFEEVDRGIKLWDKVLLCGSKHSLTSWWVDDEVQRAFSKEQQLMKERGTKTLALIPLNLDGYMFGSEWQTAKAQQIKSRLAADFTGWESDNAKFEREFERVVKSLRTDGGREEAPTSRL
jgi:hypothetical protein